MMRSGVHNTQLRCCAIHSQFHNARVKAANVCDTFVVRRIGIVRANKEIQNEYQDNHFCFWMFLLISFIFECCRIFTTLETLARFFFDDCVVHSFGMSAWPPRPARLSMWFCACAHVLSASETNEWCINWKIVFFCYIFVFVFILCNVTK